jgi:hypothetical protein
VDRVVGRSTSNLGSADQARDDSHPFLLMVVREYGCMQHIAHVLPLLEVVGDIAGQRQHLVCKIGVTRLKVRPSMGSSKSVVIRARRSRVVPVGSFIYSRY